MVQLELQKRKTNKTYKSRHSGVGIFASKIKCGECGSWYGSKVWHSNSKYRRTIYQCNGKFKGADKCKTPHFDEESIKQVFVTAVNRLISDKTSIISAFELIKDEVFDTATLETERTALHVKLTVITETMQKIVQENARITQDQTEYQRHYAELAERYEAAKTHHNEVSNLITDKQTRKTAMQAFMLELEICEDVITDFDERLWYGLVDYINVESENEIYVIFKDGTKIKAE